MQSWVGSQDLKIKTKQGKGSELATKTRGGWSMQVSMVKKRARVQEPGQHVRPRSLLMILSSVLRQGRIRDATVNQCACWGGCVEWSGQSESAVLEGLSELAGGIWTGEMTSQNSSLTYLHNLFKVSNSLSEDRMLSWPRYAPSGRMRPAKGSSPPS